LFFHGHKAAWCADYLCEPRCSLITLIDSGAIVIPDRYFNGASGVGALNKQRLNVRSGKTDGIIAGYCRMHKRKTRILTLRQEHAVFSDDHPGAIVYYATFFNDSLRQIAAPAGLDGITVQGRNDD
jgi:hypothetical protein